MKQHRIALSAAILALLVSFIVWRARTRDNANTADATLPSIDASAITEVEIGVPNNAPIVVERIDNAWTIQKPLKARADENSIVAALEKLAELRVKSIAATKASSHEKLEVDQAHGIHIVAKSGQKTVADLIVGKSNGSSTFLRKSNDDHVFTVDGSIRHLFDKDLKRWRDQKIVDVDETAITAITFKDPDHHFAFARDEENQWTPRSSLPKAFDPNTIDQFVSTVARLRAIDFAAPDLDRATAGLDAPSATVEISVKGEPSANGRDNNALGENTLVVRLGAALPDGNTYYCSRDGDDTLYTITRYVADQLHPTVTSFEAPRTPAPISPTHNTMAAPAPGAPTQVSPEMLEQLREQLKRQQAQ
ncbi:MAG: DUF4340 domain-containing protein [Polyangiales bacterium]